jgi:hypothetical protein
MKTHITPHLQWPSDEVEGIEGGVEELGGLIAYTCANLRYPKSMQEEISTLSILTKDLQLKWSSLGSEGMGEVGVAEVL